MMDSVHVAMWSGPRNISSAMMRSFENRPDTTVTDEPFYAHYLFKTRIKHPLRKKIIRNSECNFDNIVTYLTGSIPDKKKIWYQKHMAHHNLPDMDIHWTKKVINCFLIRHPKEVILSYEKRFPIESIDQLGYKQLCILFEFLKKETGKSPPVLDSRDILNHPREILNKFCDKIGISFMDQMLSWPSGRRKSDGMWGQYWYKNVEDSTGFQKYQEKNKILPDKLLSIFKESLSYFDKLYLHRIRPQKQPEEHG